MNLNAALSTDLLKEGRNKEQFVGRPFYLSYDIARLLVCDAWKAQVKGIPAGCFLLAFYDGEDGVEEAVLLRALSQTKLPTDNDVISSMIEYYKDNLDISGRAGSLKGGKLDEFTRYEFSFSGLECRVLGVFYRTQKGNIEFCADLENFYAANNYTVYKANRDVLEFIVNQRDDGGLVGQDSEFKIGSVRYSSSRRHQSQEENVNVWVNPKDFLGKRSAMFGMTRTGKSNTVKKVIEATEEISRKALILLDSASPETSEFTSSGSPTFPVGQIIFDVNGEYANANRQDSGTAIYDLYKEKVYRYSVLEKDDFKVMKVNFFKDIESGFSLISSYFQEQSLGGDYVNNFIAVSFEKPESTNLNGSEWTRYNRLIAAYKCCLYRAGFKAPNGEKIRFTGAAEINGEILEGRVLDPKQGLTLEEACTWFERVWEQYDELKFFKDYINKKGYEWANDDLKSMMVFLTTYKLPGKKNQVSGYKKIRVKQLHNLHTTSMDESFEIEIPRLLQQGKIVIVDLSQGEPVVQRLFSEKICRSTFNISMDRFINNLPNNFIQFYFEEAHNLFPKKDDKDLSQIYNRIAKEGAKLHLGMIYATQEVSSISSNILKNTQNWFIAHLNNIDETKELEKYYDFKDFTHSLVNFSATNDKGFVRMKTYTNPFIVPVQIDRFLANKGM
ncbi:ATP-binding protein [Salmonella enterica subsp. enterica]|uniref:ATP-binding protein n=1 Tax=Salmonella enterica TaxID=28901 RepID=UPI003BC4F987